MSSATSQSNLANYETDHLLLLVGKNPLPNAVAGKRLVKPGGTISLLYSNDTYRAMNALRDWFDRQPELKDVKIKDQEIKEADRDSIVGGVRERLNKAETAAIGLHYTGGTKAMAVHAYRAVEQWGAERRVEPVFSYLDARWLQLIIDGKDALYVGREVEISLRDLIGLHGWTLRNDPCIKPILPRTAQAIARACADEMGFAAWQAWQREELKKFCKADANGNRSFNHDWETRQSALRAVKLSLNPSAAPLPDKVAAALRAELGLTTDEFEIAEFARQYDIKKLVEVGKWLDGKWLEHHLLDVLNAFDDPSHYLHSGLDESLRHLHLHERAQNVVPNEVEFDLDVIALRGYQLFAFSCGADRDDGEAGGRNKLKQKLFEAAIRARQLGGDEAGAALVCCAADPDRLQAEMNRDLNTQRPVRVFGRRHLDDLPAAVGEWIQQESNEA